MTRVEKKCLFFSVGMHSLLGIIVIGSSAFRSKPAAHEMPPILTMIPAQILDREGAGGGSSAPAASVAVSQPAPSPLPVLPKPAPPVVQPQPQPQPPVVQHQEVAPVEEPKPREVEEPAPEPSPVAVREAPKPPRKHHEIHVDYTPVTASTRHTRVKPAAASEESDSTSRSESRRRKAIADSLQKLAKGVESSGAGDTVVDLPGQGGGEAFAGYETVIFNAYFHAWITPDNVADRRAGANVKIVVARDGSIISADIVDRSGDAGLDKSVERALRVVTKLPPFPAGATDEQRSFLIHFSLEAKEASG